ncbi:MAG: filamentous hemagglutinin N-terminal domain-containing protein [Methylococcaceae bacterium]
MFHSRQRLRFIPLASLLALLGSSPVSALPEGPDVAFGHARFDIPAANTLAITNSPKAIINWKDFSTRPDEIVRFIQQGSTSSVLNRVSGGNPSELLGQITSNGRVYLINPNGILFGEHSIIDTQGFLASTLNISNLDFTRNNYLFTQESQGQIKNQGLIQTHGDGSVILISSHIENQGLIHTESGQLILAAGEKLTLSSLDNPEIRFEIQPSASQVINLGELQSGAGGAVEVFAGTLTHQGRMEADSVSQDAQCRIVLSARNDLTLTAGSTLTASGPAGGDIRIESQNGTATIKGQLATGNPDDQGGSVELAGQRIRVDAVVASDTWSLTQGTTAVNASTVEPAARTKPLQVDLLDHATLTQTGPIQVGALAFSGEAQVELQHPDNRIGQLSGSVERLRLNDHSADRPERLQIGTLDASQSIDITNQGELKTTGPINSQTSSLKLLSNSPLNIGGSLSSDADLTLKAGDGTASDDVLSFQEGISLSSRHGNIHLVFNGDWQGTSPTFSAPSGQIFYNGVEAGTPTTDHPDTTPPLDLTHPETVQTLQSLGAQQNNQVVVLTQQSYSTPDATTGPHHDDTRPGSVRSGTATSLVRNASGARSSAAPVCR